MADKSPVVDKFPLPSYDFDFDSGLSRFPKYSSVVSRENYSTRDTDKRAMQSGFDQGGSPGVYDYNESTPIDMNDLPDPIYLALRDGKLDKAEVPKAKEYLQNKYLGELEKAKSDADKKSVEKMYKAQLEAVNKALGVKVDTESDSENLTVPAK